jgi:Fe-S-cluster containining protein
MNQENIYCHKGCNLCCHALTITSDPINTYILSRVFMTVPYNVLFPYFKSCLDNRIKALDYIDTLPLDNKNIITETYEKFGFTPFTCPFLNNQEGCSIYEFRPQQCFSYFSSFQCKIIYNPELNEFQKEIYEQKNKKVDNIDICGLNNDHEKYNFSDIILENYNKFDAKTIKQDENLFQIIEHSISYEMLTILSIALEFTNPEEYNNDMKNINYDFIAQIDGKINYL